jgi:hypothetical protein
MLGTDTSAGEFVKDGGTSISREPVEVRAAVAAARATAAVRTLWKILVSALSVVLVIALAGIIFTIADRNPDTSPDVIMTVFTSALTGLIGLFVKSPVQ